MPPGATPRRADDARIRHRPRRHRRCRSSCAAAIYRTGGLTLNQGITIQPYADERPVLKGTRVATEWEALRNNVWRTQWTTLFPARPLGWWRREREGMLTPLHRFNNDMVFVDGELLQIGRLGRRASTRAPSTSTTRPATSTSARIPPTTSSRSPPSTCALLRTTRPGHGKDDDREGSGDPRPDVHAVRLSGDRHRGQEAGRDRVGGTHRRSDRPGRSLHLRQGSRRARRCEHVTISYCSRVAGYFRGDRLTIRNSLVSDTGTEGIYVIGSSDVLLERNIIRRNNVEQLTGYYPAAVKIFNQSRRVTVRDNLVIEQPHSNGVWYDVGNVDGVFVNNWVEGALDGFFFEISSGAIVAGNVFVATARRASASSTAPNARVYHNTLVNAPLRRSSAPSAARPAIISAGIHAPDPTSISATGTSSSATCSWRTKSFAAPLLRFEQPQALCARLPKPQVTELDANLYVRLGGAREPLMVWGPAAAENCRMGLDSLDALRKAAPAFEQHGRAFSDYAGPLFRSAELRNFDLDQFPPGTQPVTSIAAGRPSRARLEGRPARAWRVPLNHPVASYSCGSATRRSTCDESAVVSCGATCVARHR